jgi:hypothetical protein
MAVLLQNSALPGVRAKGITPRMFEIPVMNISMRPDPKPECGTVKAGQGTIHAFPVYGSIIF